MIAKQIHSLYLHFPYCRHLCNYCDFFKTKMNSESPSFDSFHHWLEKAWTQHAIFLKEQNFSLNFLKSLYFGGGTPSLWGKEGAHFFRQFLQDKGLSFAPGYEWTVELNPGRLKESAIKEWPNVGANRFSVGVQSLRNEYLKILDRIHQKEDILETLGFLQQQNLRYSIDFMIGLPFSKKYNRNIISELDEVLSYGPEHVSLYILTVPKHYIHFQHLPGDEWIEEEYLKVSEYLERKGMIQYEVSNYALPGKESLHNLQYWKTQSVAAIGPSATGLLVKNEDQALRYQWKTEGPEVFVREELGRREMRLERLYMQMRTNRSINPREFFVGQDLESYQNLIKKWAECHYLLSISPLRIGPRGHLMLDSLMDDIFLAISDI